MSLLYECINGIIQGGILDGSEGMAEGEEIARLCVGKLRGMLVVEGDPNCKPHVVSNESVRNYLFLPSKIRRPFSF